MTMRYDAFAGIATVVTALLSTGVLAQEFPPGFLDPEPVLRAAADAIGTDRLRCVSVSGSAYTGMVGQQRLNDKNVDWPRGEPLMNYTRTMNWDTRAMTEVFDRTPGKNPASWKYGAGWMDGTRVQRNARQLFYVSGQYAWHQDGPNAAPVAARPQRPPRAGHGPRTQSFGNSTCGSIHTDF
jgi:hypothetical protein